MASVRNEVEGPEPQEPRMPFGEYRGQPLSVMAQDRSYLHWLLNISDIRDTNPSLYSQALRVAGIKDLRRDFYNT